MTKTTIAKFANTVDPDETANTELCRLRLSLNSILINVLHTQIKVCLAHNFYQKKRHTFSG